MSVSDKLLVDAYDSRLGLYQPGGLGGGVGANGGYETSAAAEIWGALWCAADTGVDTKAPNTIKQELHVGGPLRSSDSFDVGQDAYVNGDVSTSASITIAKTLLVPAAATVSPNVSYGALTRGAVTVPRRAIASRNSLSPSRPSSPRTAHRTTTTRRSTWIRRCSRTRGSACRLRLALRGLLFDGHLSRAIR